MPTLSELTGGGTLRLSDLGEGDVQIIGEQPQTPEELDSAWDFSGNRTIGGRITEMGKAFPRELANLVLLGAQGTEALTDYVPGAKLGEYIGEKAIDLMGKKEEYLRAKAEQKTYIPKAIDYLNQESILAGDEKYQDLWTTSLAGGAGSMVGFVGATMLSPAAGVTLAVTSGVGTQEQKLNAAEAAGEDISDFERLYGRTLGGAIGALEMWTPSRLLKMLPKNIPVPDKDKIFTMFKEALKTGAGEGTQEVMSSILQNVVEMGYNPNAELPASESLWTDFTVGAVIGGGAQITRDVIQNNRMNAVSQVEYDREREVRMREDANNLQLKEKMLQDAQAREAAESDPDAFLRDAGLAQQQAATVPLPSAEEVKQFNAPSIAGATVTPPALAELYAYRIIGSLGKYFPSNTSFTVNQEGGTEAQPLFVVRDAAGTQYGQPLPDKRVASYLASNLNKEVQNNGVRATILDTLKTSPEGYKLEDMDGLFRYGFRTLNPDSNRVTFAALNEAAGTTTENGFVEDVPLEILAGGKEMSKGRFQITMPDGTSRILPGLTASQKLNLERLNKGLPVSTTFDINEARSFLGGNIGKLADPNVAGIEDGLQYGAVIQNGKPVVVSEAGEVLSKRKTTAVERANAGVDENGKSFLGDYADFKTLDEAKRYAGRLNQRKGASRVMPSEILEGKKDLLPEIQSMLAAKNISSELNSPEVGQLVKAFTGAESVADMTQADQKLFYNRLRALPKLSRQTKLPLFKQREYSPEQFSRASAITNRDGYLNESQIADVLEIPESDPAVKAIHEELVKQNNARYAELQRRYDTLAPIAEDVRAFFREFGLNPMEAGMNLDVRLMEDGVDVTDRAEGFYDPAMKEIALSVDAIDPEGNKTQEERVNALREVLSHEVIHALRSMDLFTQKEWSLLESAVLRTQKPGTGMTYLQWARRSREQGGYADQSPLVQVEEAVADMARDFIGNRRLIGGKPRNLLERIIRFFQKARNLMDGYGFNTFEQVLQAVERGDVGRRQIGKLRTARSTEALVEKTLGLLPARYAKFGDIFSQGPTAIARQAPAPRAQQAQTAQDESADFNPADLVGAEIRESRKRIRESRKPMTSSRDWAYSPLMKMVEQASPKITTAQQWSQWLDANAPKLGVSKDEIEFSGIKDFLSFVMKDGKVTKEDVNNYLDNYGIVVNDVVKSDDYQDIVARHVEATVEHFNSAINQYHPFGGKGAYTTYSNGILSIYGPDNYLYFTGKPSRVANEANIETDEDTIREYLISDYIENYVNSEPARFVNGDVIVYPDGSIGVYSDNNPPVEGSPSFVARRIGIDTDQIDSIDETKWSGYMPPGGKNYRELLLTLENELPSNESFYILKHWHERNIIAHARIDERIDVDGKKVMFVGETQSDWGQTGRDKGFKDKKGLEVRERIDGIFSIYEKGGKYPLQFYDGTDGFTTREKTEDALKKSKPSDFVQFKHRVPSGPFVKETKNWLSLALKRILALAVNEGYDKVAFISGEQAAEMYELSQNVSKIEWHVGSEELYITDLENKRSKVDDGVNENNLAEYVGKEVAEGLIKSEYDNEYSAAVKTASGDDLKVGGKGMKKFYNEIFPQTLRSVIKEVGGDRLDKTLLQTKDSVTGGEKHTYSLVSDIKSGTAKYYVIEADGPWVPVSPIYDRYEDASEWLRNNEPKYKTEQLSVTITPEMAKRISAGQRLFSRKPIPGAKQPIPDFIDVDGVQRPTKNSNGDYIFFGSETGSGARAVTVDGEEILPTEDGVRNFWRWFGDSDTVDEQGRPIVYYHGTPYPGQIEEFKSNTGMYWATPSKHFANVLAMGFDGENDGENLQGSVLPVYVRSVNAFRYNNLSHLRALTEQIGKRLSKARFSGMSDEASAMLASEYAKKVKTEMLVDYAKYEGSKRPRGVEEEEGDNWKLYESYVEDIYALGFDGFHVWESGVDNIASFDKGSLKSAVSNIGTYSPTDSRIRYSRKDLQGEPRIPFEVAPSPDNKERTAAWRLVPHEQKVKITQSLGPKAVREAAKILGIDSAAFDPIISGQGLFEGHVNPNQILGIRQQFLEPEEALQFAAVLGRILEQKAMIVADGRMTGRDTSVVRIQTNVSSPKVADRIYAALTAELGDLGGYSAYKNHIDVFNFTDMNGEALAKRFIDILNTNAPDIKARVSHDTIQSAYFESESYDSYIRRKKSANQERLERGIESARSRIIGELETSISRAGQRSDEQSRVRGLAPREGRDTDTEGRAGPAKRLEEVKGPDWLPIPKLENTEQIPVFSQSKPKKDSVSAFVAHYSNAQGLMSLDGSFAGSASAGREARRFGLGNYGKKAPPGSLARRLYFYVQSKSSIPKKEKVVAGNSIYRARLDNLYDAYNDPRGFSDEAGMNADYFEELVSEAGFDGAIYSQMPGIDEPTVVLFGLKKKVPVRPYKEPEPEQPVDPISQDDAIQAVTEAAKKNAATIRGYVEPYNLESSPEALKVAQNPDSGVRLNEKDKKRYSRKNTIPLTKEEQEVVDRLTSEPPNETVGKTILDSIGIPPLNVMVSTFRMNFIDNYARLGYYTRNKPELMENDAATSSYVAALMADRSRMFTQGALTTGIPVYKNGIVQIEDFIHNGKKYRGLIDVMMPLFDNPYEASLEQLAQSYAAAIRGERINAEGKVTPAKPGDRQKMEAAIKKFVNPVTGQPIIQEWYDAWQAYNSNMVKFLRDTGVIDEAGAKLWMAQADYIPFYKENEDGTLAYPKVFGGMTTSANFKAVGKSAKSLNIPMLEAITNNIDAGISMGMKNVAQQRIVRDMIKIGLARMVKPNEKVGNQMSVTFKIAGNKYSAIIDDPLIYESMQAIPEMPLLNGIFGRVLRFPTTMLRELIVREPGYMMANLMRDTIASYITTGAKIIPVVDNVRAFGRGLENLERYGVIGGFDFRMESDNITSFFSAQARRRGHRVPVTKGGLGAKILDLPGFRQLETIWELTGDLSNRTEAATREAVFEDILARTGSQAEAMWQAASVMNYSVRGRNPLIRLLTTMVPFINARIQGMDKLTMASIGNVGAQYKVSERTGKLVPDLDRKKNFARFALRASVLTALTILYYGMVDDDEIYKTQSPEMRDNYYLFPVKKANLAEGEEGLAVRVPIPFEIGVLFKVLPERILASVYGDDTSRDVNESLKRQLTTTLGLNPIPQAVLPLYEAYTNYDFFTNREVVPYFVSKLPPEQQKNFYTNVAAQKIGEATGISPMKIQHIAEGYGGSLGTYALQMVDSIVREFGDSNEMALPDKNWFEYPSVKRFFTTANAQGLQNNFYDLKKQTDIVASRIKTMEEDGRYDELGAFYEANAGLIDAKSYVDETDKELRSLRKVKKEIEEMDLSPEEKREQIDGINNQINILLWSVPQYRKQAFGSEE